ncbi:MAG: hypothetical protein NT029_05365 [Armatimonadetes bacterium]|nr:hypothetical protein [Armatimonadota bacterium]
MDASERERASFELSAFGASEVRVDGEPVVFLPRKAKWLLMLLALASAEDRSLSRKELSSALWPWGDGSEYNVYRLMPKLRGALKTEASRIVEPVPHVLRLDLRDADVDLLRYRSALASAVQQADPAPIEAVPELRPSRLMLDFPEGEATMERERAKLRVEFIDALDAIADRAIPEGDLDGAARSIALAIAETQQPDEARTRRLIETLAQLSRHEEARAALEAYQRRGGYPSEQLVKLVRSADAVREAGPRGGYGQVAAPPVRSEHSQEVRRELAALVHNEGTAAKLRRYLRDKPHLLVGSHHVLADTVMCDVRLSPGVQTDFAYLEPQSGLGCLHMISFADPSARIFRERGEFTAQFYRACEVLDACAYWIGRNQVLLPAVFGPRLDEVPGTSLAPGFYLPRCRLIIGRRSELDSARCRDKLHARRGAGDSGIVIRTYDGFLEEAEPTIRTNPRNELGIKCRNYDGD